jgi:hypothetical protein
VDAPAKAHRRLTRTAIAGIKEKRIVLNLPSRTKSGTPGGCGTPAVQEHVRYSPLSQKLTLGASVIR